MTIQDIKDVIKESLLWRTLSPGDKIEALVYAVEKTDTMPDKNGDSLDVSDIIADMFSVVQKR